jgi:hypothetical protein
MEENSLLMSDVKEYFTAQEKEKCPEICQLMF